MDHTRHARETRMHDHREFHGAVGNVAGICNERANVMGLMPHPEHAVEASIGGTDGRVILGSLVDALGAGR